jgi:co-chaperonin GroES (HSP10)
LTHESRFDPIRPQVTSLSQARPFYEDRVLVRWVPPSGTESADSLIVSPQTPNHRDTGPQQGIVVAVGRGNTGITKLTKGREGQPMVKLKKFKGGGHIEPTVKPGDRVLYARVPDCEFMDGGELYSFLFEEQHVLGILEAA